MTHDSRALAWESTLVAFLLAFAFGYSLWAMSLGLTHPILDAHSFRQTQTAISAYYLAMGGPWLAYQTPVLGPPWALPFEFPLYQWIVALLAEPAPQSLDRVGRIVSIVFFYLTLIPLYVVLGCLGLPRRHRLLGLAFVLLSPLYLFWSRTVLIESTALFFSVSYLALGLHGLRAGRTGLLCVAMIVGVVAALVKVTTFVALANAVLLMLLVDWKTRDDCAWRFSTLFRLGSRAVLLVGVPVAFALLWTQFADAHKSLNPLAASLTSEAISSHNFGTLEQRLSGEFWLSRIWARMLVHAVGNNYLLVLLLLISAVQAVRGDRRHRAALCCVLLFLLPTLLFTNLHAVHDYYQYANALYLCIAVSLIISALSDLSAYGKLFAALAAFGVVAASLYTHSTDYLPLQTTPRGGVFLDLATRVRQVTDRSDVIVVRGLDWGSEVAYYSERRAVMISDKWSGDEAVEKIVRSLRDYHVGAMLVCREARGRRERVARRVAGFGLSPAPVQKTRLCDLYTPAPV